VVWIPPATCSGRLKKQPKPRTNGSEVMKAMKKISTSQKLTIRQEELIAEIDKIIDEFGLNHHSIQGIAGKINDSRTIILEGQKRSIVTGYIVRSYTFIDELLSLIIFEYYFKGRKGYLKYKKDHLFQEYILDKIYMPTKIELAKKIINIPSDIIDNIWKIHNLRNDLAHAFFPENRKLGTKYKGETIFSAKGAELFSYDFNNIRTLLVKRWMKMITRKGREGN
jgi:hypothetical protein